MQHGAPVDHWILLVKPNLTLLVGFLQQRLVKGCSRLELPSLLPPHLLQWQPSLLSSMDVGLCRTRLCSPSCSILSSVVFLPPSTLTCIATHKPTFLTTFCSPTFSVHSCLKGAFNGSLSHPVLPFPPITFVVLTWGSSDRAVPGHMGPWLYHEPPLLTCLLLLSPHLLPRSGDVTQIFTRIWGCHEKKEGRVARMVSCSRDMGPNPHPATAMTFL